LVGCDRDECRDNSLKSLFTTTISESVLMAEHNAAKSQPRKRTYVNIPVEDRKVRFRLSELERVIPDIKGQIVARDFKLIEQSDMVVAYIPQRDSRPELSVGVINELAYARQCTIDTYAIWPSNKNASPFLQVSRIFRNVESFCAFINQKQLSLHQQ